MVEFRAHMIREGLLHAGFEGSSHFLADRLYLPFSGKHRIELELENRTNAPLYLFLPSPSANSVEQKVHLREGNVELVRTSPYDLLGERIRTAIDPYGTFPREVMEVIISNLKRTRWAIVVPPGKHRVVLDVEHRVHKDGDVPEIVKNVIKKIASEKYDIGTLFRSILLAEDIKRGRAGLKDVEELEQLRSGDICRHKAEKAIKELRKLGFEARSVSVWRDPEATAGHELVEVRIGDKWVALDPTYGEIRYAEKAYHPTMPLVAVQPTHTGVKKSGEVLRGVMRILLQNTR